MSFVDLTHYFENNMPGFKMKNLDGSFTQYSAKIYPFLSHEQTKKYYTDSVSFEITQLEFQSSIGTYIDSPYHRYKELEDISELLLEDLILDAIVIDVSGSSASESINIDVLDDLNIKNKVILFYFGWDKYWGTDDYYDYPFISEQLIDELIARKVKMVGVDTINIDDHRNLSRPAHSKFLKNRILIVENLTNLNKLINKKFRFYAIPIKAKNTAAMPIRAFAELL